MKFEQRNFFLFLVIAILAFAGVNRYIQFLLRKCQVGSIAKVNAVMAHQLDADIMVWGSSTAVVHFNPELIQKHLNLTCFNMGMDGTPFQQYAGLLEEYLGYAKAKVIVLSVDLTGFKRRPSLYLGYNWLHHINNDHIYESVKSIDPELAFKSRYVPMYYITTYDRRFLTRCLKWVYSPAAYEKELDFKGFHPEDLTWGKDSLGNYSSMKAEEFSQLEMDAEILARFERVIKLAGEKGIRVIIVSPPCYTAFQSQIKGLSDFVKLLESFRSSEVGVFNYLDSPICSNRSYFYNNLHLNTNGANYFSDTFSSDLKQWLDEVPVE